MASGALGARGRYAFWIGDEGIKAKVNLPDANAPFPAATVTEWDKGFAGSAAQRSAIESVTPSLNATAAALLPGGFSANFQAWRTTDIGTAGNWNLLQLPHPRRPQCLGRAPRRWLRRRRHDGHGHPPALA
jgi:hypothetical protein